MEFVSLVVTLLFTSKLSNVNLRGLISQLLTSPDLKLRNLLRCCYYGTTWLKSLVAQRWRGRLQLSKLELSSMSKLSCSISKSNVSETCATIFNSSSFIYKDMKVESSSDFKSSQGARRSSSLLLQQSSLSPINTCSSL